MILAAILILARQLLYSAQSEVRKAKPLSLTRLDLA